MTRKRKTTVLGILAGILCLMVTGCSKSSETTGNADSAHSYTYWMAQGEESSYYASYNQNPCVEYMLSKTYKDKAGKDTKIGIDFQVPATGTAQNNLMTVISTGDYSDIMDMSLYPGSIVDLYEQGTVQDITYYVENYMPNYMAFLDANPEYKRTATNVVDGETKYLQLYYYKNTIQEQWGGFMYRRDWIVNYGKNPKDGSSFSGEYTLKNDDGTWNVDSWKDNVIFPSGSADPIYISDWEWMFDIFQTAMENLGITDGYCMSLYYPGYSETGEINCAFGGGAPTWYKNKNNEVVFGPVTDDFRTYLVCMNNWYTKGWIDTAFPEHATDMFYKIDDAKVRQGKIGLWYGLKGELIGRLDLGDGYTKGMIVFAARQPINDIYGTDAQKNVEPYTMYQQGLEGPSIVITDKAAEKDMVALFSFLDYTFSDEVMIMKNIGLSKDQYEAIQNELYTKNGLTEGAYTVTVTDDGIHELELADQLKLDGNLLIAAKYTRPFGLDGLPDKYVKVDSNDLGIYKHNIDEWSVYTNTGRFEGSFVSQLSAEDSLMQAKVLTNIREFLSKNIPDFIKGKRDPNNDKDWSSYIKAVSKYNPDSVTPIYQKLLDELSKE